MSVTEEDRERARAVVHGLNPEHAYVDEFVFDGEAEALREAVAQALADERERATEAERLTWNPMIGRVLIAVQAMEREDDPVARHFAKRINDAIAGKS